MSIKERKGTFVSNQQTEIPTHFCWMDKKVFIFPDNGRDHKCLSCGSTLLAYFDDPVTEEHAIEAVAALIAPH
jgi:hypothetical protein